MKSSGYCLFRPLAYGCAGWELGHVTLRQNLSEHFQETKNYTGTERFECLGGS